MIGITGSVGKTTTKECISAILSAYFPTLKTLDSRNQSTGVPLTILQVRPRHKYAVIEIGTGRPGSIQRLSKLVKPHIAIILAVAKTHSKMFTTLEDTAVEKAKILNSVSAKGLTILNAEDPRVKQMALNSKSKVKMFGLSNELNLWADKISSKWPNRLSLQVNTNSETQIVNSNLVGEHWINSILAALLTAINCGIDLKKAVLQLEKVEPFIARMQPVLIPCGATIIRDEFNGAFDTLTAAFQVLKEANVKRRVLVMSNVSDSKENSRVRFKKLGRIAPQISDLAIFISEYGHYAVKTATEAGMSPDCVKSFIDLKTANNYLKSEFRDGDLILLKGRSSDHLSRIFFGQHGEINCWKNKCVKMMLCDLCDELKPDFDIQKMLPVELRKKSPV
ncbi:MAG TPA: UDP-N-acetylmuramoyl-tripeptide--D-alanyl-D-alanine ligase [Ignavibacteriaceae bacterium]|nr:UDP-N-acetylmuramoyl-tripeptide--D-alanyl-D-alanine ligase [Ignavibacteriaceae bacterium]